MAPSGAVAASRPSGRPAGSGHRVAGRVQRRGVCRNGGQAGAPSAASSAACASCVGKPGAPHRSRWRVIAVARAYIWIGRGRVRPPSPAVPTVVLATPRPGGIPSARSTALRDMGSIASPGRASASGRCSRCPVRSGKARSPASVPLMGAPPTARFRRPSRPFEGAIHHRASSRDRGDADGHRGCTLAAQSPSGWARPAVPSARGEPIRAGAVTESNRRARSSRGPRWRRPW